MRVVPIKKFGRYLPGQPFDFPDKAAKVFIKVGKLRAATPEDEQFEVKPMQYANRMLTAGALAPARRQPSAAPAETPVPRSVIQPHDGEPIDITDMEKEALHDLAEKLGVEVHHASGAAKVRAALLEALPT